MSAAGFFWGSAAAVAYTYVGFPVILGVRALASPRPFEAATVTPSVSIIIAARNEGAVIGRKIENLLKLDYDDALMEIIVASDGCDDDTDAIVGRYSPSGVQLLSLPRVGKAHALNAAIAASTHSILIFTDANSMLERDAVRALVRPFADAGVGGVAGDQRYIPVTRADGLARSEQHYWSLDRLLKLAESRAGNVISATGALYAVRRELASPIPDGVTDDFYASTGVIERGQRLVFVPDAIAREATAPGGRVEFGRKVRVMTRGLRAVLARRALLDPRKQGFYAVQLLSHKVLRRLMALPLLVLAATAPFLAGRHLVYRLAAIGQGLFYAAAAIGLLRSRSGSDPRGPFRIPAYFCLVNAASITALWKIARGHRIDRWEPERTRTDSAEVFDRSDT